MRKLLEINTNILRFMERRLRLALALSLFAGLALVGRAAPLDQWTQRHSPTPGTALHGVTFGNRKFVAVGGTAGGLGGRIFTSSDGTNWTSQTSGTPNALWGVTYAYGSFVAVGQNGTILTSSNGISWSNQNSPVTTTVYSVAAGNGEFIAVGDAGYDWLGFPENYLYTTSASGVDVTSWSDDLVGATAINGICFGNGLFVAVTGREQALTSADGNSWNTVTLGTSQELDGVSYGNGTYVAVGGYGTIFTSPNGTNWTARISRTTNDLYGVAYGNGLFVAVGPAGKILSSPDGMSWTSRTSGTGAALSSVAYGNDSFIAVGDQELILQSGLTTRVLAPWRDQDIGDVGAAGSAAYGNGAFTVQGSGADIWGYQDAFHFVYQPLNGNGAIVARVSSLQNTDPWAKAGVMIRQSADPGSPQAMMVMTPSNGTAFQYRVNLNGLSYSVGGPNTSATAPYWVKLVRSGTTFTSYQSANGSTWTVVGSATIPMTNAVYIGLAVTAHSYDALNTVTFDQVQVVGSQLPPLLSAAAGGNQALTLSWPNSASGLILQATASLSPPVNWTTVTNAPVLTNGQFALTPLTTNGQQFYRLKSP